MRITEILIESGGFYQHKGHRMPIGREKPSDGGVPFLGKPKQQKKILPKGSQRSDPLPTYCIERLPYYEAVKLAMAHKEARALGKPLPDPKDSAVYSLTAAEKNRLENGINPFDVSGSHERTALDGRTASKYNRQTKAGKEVKESVTSLADMLKEGKIGGERSGTFGKFRGNVFHAKPSDIVTQALKKVKSSNVDQIIAKAGDWIRENTDNDKDKRNALRNLNAVFGRGEGKKMVAGSSTSGTEPDATITKKQEDMVQGNNSPALNAHMKKVAQVKKEVAIAKRNKVKPNDADVAFLRNATNIANKIKADELKNPATLDDLAAGKRK